MNIHICCRTNLAKDIMLFHKAADRMIQNAKLNGPATLIDGSSQRAAKWKTEIITLNLWDTNYSAKNQPIYRLLN